MPQMTRAALAAEIASRLPDNTTGEISEQDIRDVLNAIADSALFIGEGAVGITGVITEAGTAYGAENAEDQNVVRFTASSDVTVTIPTDATKDFRIGANLHFVQSGAGTVKLVAAPGATLEYPSRYLPQTLEQGNAVSILKIAANTWRLFGTPDMVPEQWNRYIVWNIGASSGTTLQIGQQNEFIVFNTAGAVTLTVPLNATTELPIGFEVYFTNKQAGVLTVSPEAGVTISKMAGYSDTLAGAFAVGRLIKIGTDEWLLTGQLGAS